MSLFKQALKQKRNINDFYDDDDNNNNNNGFSIFTSHEGP
jgi:hypothetical protein